jgi:membrane peptidoglycan carboxypeptidase
MPSVSQTIKFRNRRRFREKRNPWMRIGLVLGIVFSIFLAVAGLIGFWYYANLTRNLPSVEALPSLLDPPDGTMLHPTRLYDRSHQQILLTLENPAAAGRQYLYVGDDGQAGKDQFPQNLIDATIAEYEPDFWTSPGFTLSGLSEGTHATLAQRLVSDLVLDNEPPSIQRNIRERLLAAQITAQFGRKKILEWYLNSVQYGYLIYGADAAARVYFGKSANELNLAEVSMLTAISEMPAISPLSGSQILQDQQENVIDSMVTNRMINPGEAQKALLKNIRFQAQQETHSFAPAFTDFALTQLSTVLPIDRIRRGGYEIVTSLDYDLQKQAACAVQAQVDRLEGNGAQFTNLDGSTCEAAQLLPTIQPNENHSLQDVRVNLVIQDPSSGQILALVGDSTTDTVPAYPEKHPAGTIISPFLYLTAFARGMGPGTLLWDIPENGEPELQVTDQTDINEGPDNTYHGPVRLRIAFANDYLASASNVLQQVGFDNVWLTEKRFGINTSELDMDSTKTVTELYSQPISLVNAVQAYGVLANQGIMAGTPDQNDLAGAGTYGLSPTSILRFLGDDGNVLLDWSNPQSRPIISSQLAYLVTNVLSDENARRLSLGHPNSLEIGRPAAAKLGETYVNNSAWAIGYIPQLVVGIWMGDQIEGSGGISTDIPAGLWHAIMQYSSKHMAVQDFSVPEGISLLQVCDPSGLLVSDQCPSIVQEVFLSGNEPTQVDNLYQKFFINRESESLATIFTPSNMLTEQVYMVVPPEAEAWAEQAGLPIPPDTYDDIYVAQAPSEYARITYPQQFTHISGQINITGTAAGSDFLYYRLQEGKGLNPQEWIQIGEDNEQPVYDGKLGTWDTQDLEGLFVLQLLVVYQDQRVERDILQVTIDNTIPQIRIISPIAGEKIIYTPGDSIMMQVEVVDNLVLERVEFYMDGSLESILLGEPFIILWPSMLGEHTLMVKAYDLAGNTSHNEVSFSVIK